MTRQTTIPDLFRRSGLPAPLRPKAPLNDLWLLRARRNCAVRLIKELEGDIWVHDPQNWRAAGMTAEEIRLRYELCENAPVQAGGFPVATAERSFRFILPILRRSFRVPVDVLVNRLLAARKRSLLALCDHWEQETLLWIRGAQAGELLIQDVRDIYDEWRRVLCLLGRKPADFQTLCEQALAATQEERLQQAEHRRHDDPSFDTTEVI